MISRNRRTKYAVIERWQPPSRARRIRAVQRTSVVPTGKCRRVVAERAAQRRVFSPRSIHHSDRGMSR